jgi:hypothetical protein
MSAAVEWSASAIPRWRLHVFVQPNCGGIGDMRQSEDVEDSWAAPW